MSPCCLSRLRQEAAELSSLKPQLDELGVPLYAVLKEDVGTEVQDFRPFFEGELFLDDKVTLGQRRRFHPSTRSFNASVSWLAFQKGFFGPRERRMGAVAFLRLGVWMNGLRAFRKGFRGNVSGEGFVLGGVFVIGRGDQVRLTSDLMLQVSVRCVVDASVLLWQGILLEHREVEFGDKVNVQDVMQAARRISHEQTTNALHTVTR